jgi:serine/threonine-protein kinase
VLLGKYRVEDVLGVGGMGRVVRASHQYLNQSFAIKVLLPTMVENPSTVARFLREAQATSRLKSEHFARVLDVGTLPDGVPYMVMEYLEGNDLNQILRHHGPQLPGLVCDMMLQACEGLAEAHALGFVHRDIKPSNFFVTQRPDGSMLLKILDFGISKTPVGYDDLTGTQTVIGTPSYMAPEQMKSVRSADARSDVWSLGVVMYQLLEGRPPFSGESYAELVIKVGMEPPEPMHAQLPPGLGDVLQRCLTKDPAQRQQDVGELARMLSPFASDPIVGAQIAARTTRIVQQRASRAGVGPTSGLLAPVALGPLTPQSWPPAHTPTPTSVSAGKGQMTYRTGRSKGWLVAGAVSVALLAGVGGFVASEALRTDDREIEPSAAPPPVPAPAPATMPAPATTPTTTATTTPPPPPSPPPTPPPTTAIKTTTATTTPTTATKTTPTKTTAAKTTAKTTGAKTTTAKSKSTRTKSKSTSTKSTSSKTKTGTKSKSGLFDSRH